MAILVSSNFDSGNIEVIKADEADDIQVKVRKDTNSDFLQWFHFRVNGVREQEVKIRIMNAAETTYPEGWDNYRCCVSYDRNHWFRTDTEYVNGELVIKFYAEHDTVNLAYFTPYSYDAHQDLIATCQTSGLAEHQVIGHTVEGRDLDLITLGEEMFDEYKVWVIARQHPGESMAEWFMEGFLSRLLDPDDSVSRKLVEQAVFYIVPNMNPDGSILGNLRSNAAGANLNREWADPSEEKSPEVYWVLKKMEETGVDLLLDVHGDEELPYNFISANEGIPSYTKEMNALEEGFKNYWASICPDFQTEHGYDLDKPGEADLRICTNQIAEKFGAVALTIEMPFKDNDDLPDPAYGWSAERCQKLGESVLDPVLNILPKLKG
jgi:murein tripeptide amidase MpaA